MCSLKTPENIICSKRNLLGQGTKGVAEGFGGKVKESLEEDVDLQRVEAFAFIWQKKNREWGECTKVYASYFNSNASENMSCT